MSNQSSPPPGRAVDRTGPGGMLITTAATVRTDTTIDLHWSSLAAQPAIWMRFEGGESIDPRDPKGLTFLPLTNAVLLDAAAARGLRTALEAWIERLDAAEGRLHPDRGDGRPA